MTTLAAMDPAAFEEMRSEMGDIFQEVVQTFLEYIPEQAASLNDAIENNDPKKVFSIAHSIKSSSSSIGALGLASTAEQIEMLGRRGTTEGTSQPYSELQTRLNEVIDFLQKELQNL